MKALWRRLFGRESDMDDATTAYIEGRASPAEFDAVSRDLGESAERERDIEELRRTVALLRSVETPPAPRSFALTPDMVPEQQRAWRLDLSYAPAAAAAVLILAIGVLIAGDLTDLVRQSEMGAVESMSAPVQFADSETAYEEPDDTVTVAESVVERAGVQQEAAPASPAATETAAPAPAMQMKVVETVVVEKAVTTVETVVATVVVEKPVTRTEKVVEKVVEEEAETAEMVVATVVVEKQVAREETVEKPVAMQAGQESDESVAKEEIEINETPAGAMAVEAESIADSPAQATPTPVAVQEKAATASPDDRVKGKPGPAGTPAPTIEPTAPPTATPVPTLEPTPKLDPTPIVLEEPAAPLAAEQDEERGITLPLWQIEVLLAFLAALMLALWAVLRRRSGRNRR